jgi:cytochrome c oxidase assembly protein Cox11
MVQASAAMGVYIESTLVVTEAIVPVYRRICQVNAVVGVFTKFTLVIEATVLVYNQMCQVNAVMGVKTELTLVIKQLSLYIAKIFKSTLWLACITNRPL